MTTKETLKMRLNENEVSEVKWVNFETLKEEISLSPSSFTPWLRIYIQDHFDQIIN